MGVTLMVNQGSNEHKPQNTDFIVAAGTVTESSVEAMGSGFTLFKNQFGATDLANSPEWVNTLQSTIDAYKQGTAAMPAFQGVTHGSLQGGIATVPALNTDRTVMEHCDKAKSKEDQYKEAVTGAIQAARAAGKPLYIQPLGIGVYNWPPDEAARLFAEAIDEDAKQNSDKPVDIKIPIYNIAQDSADLKFQQALTTKLQEKKITVDTNKQPASSTNASPTSTNVSAANEQLLDALSDAYRKKYFKDDQWKKGFAAPTTQDGVTKLTFPDPDTAHDFFSEQAKNGQSFCILDENKQVVAYSQDGQLLKPDGSEFKKGDPLDKATPGKDGQLLSFNDFIKQSKLSLEPAADTASPAASQAGLKQGVAAVRRAAEGVEENAAALEESKQPAKPSN